MLSLIGITNVSAMAWARRIKKLSDPGAMTIRSKNVRLR
jgi:hypothetical protein